MRTSVIKSIWSSILIVSTAVDLFGSGTANSDSTRREPSRQDETRVVRFETDEGSWMTVDVSPDGRTVVFDLLGQLYTIPIEGGTATPLLRTEWQWDRCPRFSPDGKKVAFISDREAGDDLWVLELASGNLHRVDDPVPASSIRFTNAGTKGGAGCAVAWLPTGREIAYGRVRTEAGEPDLRIVSADGSDARWFGPAAKAWSEPRDKSVAYLPDMSTAFYSVAVRGGRPKYKLRRRDLVRGVDVQFGDPSTGADEFNPEVSRSGRLLAYGRWLRGHAELRIRDLRTQEDRRLIGLPGVLRDPPNTQTTEPLPGYSFTPDERHIVIWNSGKILKVSIDNGKVEEIPFRAKVERRVARRHSRPFPLNDGPVRARALRWPNLSSDRRTLFFDAVGAIWLRSLPDGAPRKLSTGAEFEAMPALSPDGTRLAFVSFPHGMSGITPPGRMMVRDLRTGNVTSASRDEGDHFYMGPSWSPDGSKIAALRWRVEGDKSVYEYGWVDPIDGKFNPVGKGPRVFGEQEINRRATHAFHVSWSANGQRLLFQNNAESGRSGEVTLEEASLAGTGHRVLARSDSDVYGIYPSPDGSRVLLVGWDYQGYMVDLKPNGSEPAALSIKMPGARRISDRGVMQPRWESNERLTYGWLDRVYEYRAGKPKARELSRTELELPRRQGAGMVAYRNARLITIAGDRGAGPVIEHGTVLVRGRRIAAVGPVESVKIPPEARVIDATGLTIMPGLVDTHYHALANYLTVNPIGATAFDRAVAYGVTTAFGASASEGDDETALQDLLETGRLRGPRYFNGHMVGHLHPNNIRDGETFESVNARTEQQKELGAGPCLKIGELPERSRWIQRIYGRVARHNGLCVIAHTDTADAALTHIIDGITPHHPAMRTPAYKDVVQFFIRADASWTPHFFLLDGSLSRWYFDNIQQRLPTAHREKLRNFYGDWIDQNYPVKNAKPITPEYIADLFANSQLSAVRSISEAGGKVAVSGDYVIFGDLRHQMEIYQMYGLPRGEILRGATMTAAEQLGLDRDVGSLEPGKIADFLVLEANPLDDVFNSLLLKWTVIDGVVYDRRDSCVRSTKRLAEFFYRPCA